MRSIDVNAGSDSLSEQKGAGVSGGERASPKARQRDGDYTRKKITRRRRAFPRVPSVPPRQCGARSDSLPGAKRRGAEEYGQAPRCHAAPVRPAVNEGVQGRFLWVLTAVPWVQEHLHDHGGRIGGVAGASP